MGRAVFTGDDLNGETRYVRTDPTAHDGPPAVEAPGDQAVGPSPLGRTLGHYRLEARLGAGGMGEVFRARDVALGRPAALKLLPRTLSQDLRARLRREAEAVARLQHPAIATFYETGEEDDETFIAMECVQGTTLRERLRGGAMPVEEGLAVISCVLAALGHAHAAGFLHRDIKPENIMVTGPRTAKLLDFGLALPLGATDAAVEESGSRPTGSVLTVAGSVVGTIGYMAPEQIRNEVLDARVDVFQSGAVLYEMLTGQPAFPGRSPAERLAAILTRDPDFAPLGAPP
ncbi:MAG TPA: serine/threonine-protein kinase, partial [Vicinamibacteria bacterium]|nr:serine/threonine-protein kinase [Vicinamibacteria bacterium]